MIYLLDTNILIYLIKKKPPQVADRIDALPEEDQLAMLFLPWSNSLSDWPCRFRCCFPKAQRSASTMQSRQRP